MSLQELNTIGELKHRVTAQESTKVNKTKQNKNETDHDTFFNSKNTVTIFIIKGLP